MIPDDSELLRRYSRDDADGAFRELVQRHVGVVFHVALRQVGGDSHRAEEVVQEVFTLLARKAAVLAEHPMLIGWLFSATRKVAARAQRTELRRQRREQLAWEAATVSSADDEADWSRLKPVLDAALESLAARDRDALLLRFFQEHPFGEIGRRMAVSEDAARMRVERALEKLRVRLARLGITSTAAALALVLTANASAAAPNGLAASVSTAALSGAATAGGTLALVTKILLMTKTQSVVAGGALVLLAGGVVWQASGYAAAERQLLAERQRGEALRTAVSRREPLLSSVVGPAAQRTAALALSAADEEKRRQWVLPKRKVYDRQYAALYRRLRLPPSQLEEFQNLLAEREWDQIEAFKLARKNGLKDISKRESRQLGEIAGFDANEKIRALLGDANYSYFERYERTAPLRNLFSRMVDEAKGLGDPIRDDQMDRFLELVDADGMVESLYTWREGDGPRISDAVVAEAGAFFSPTQIECLRAAQEELDARARIAAWNREAARQGKLALNRSSAKNYPGSPIAK